MINNKQINKSIANILGLAETYDLRRELKIIFYDMTLEEAQDALKIHPESERHLYTITSSVADNYSEDINLALYAAKRIAERNHQTFVLSLEEGTWKAAYGDWGNCAEYSGSNPAYTTCVAVLKFMGKL